MLVPSGAESRLEGGDHPDDVGARLRPDAVGVGGEVGHQVIAAYRLARPQNRRYLEPGPGALAGPPRLMAAGLA